MHEQTQRTLTRRRFGRALAVGVMVLALTSGACGGGSDGSAGSRDDPFPYKDPNSRCGNVSC